MAQAGEHCYMTLVMSDSYLPGAMILGHSLKDSGTHKELVALVTLDTLSADSLEELKTIYRVVPIDRIANKKPANLFLMGRPDLLYAFTKIALWRQTQYRKIVYLDADIVALKNLDHLFSTEEPFAAAPDIGWPDAFNSGMMVLTPNMGEYWALSALAEAGDSFDGADQGLLNQYYEGRPWKRLSFTYNCTPNAEYQWEPAYRYHKSSIKAVHFIGKDKPWFTGRKNGNGTYGELVGRWWSVYDRHYKTAPTYQPGKSYSRSTAVQQRVFGENVDLFHGVPVEERLPPPSATDIAPAIVEHKAPDQRYELHQQSSASHQVPTLTIDAPTPDEQSPRQTHQHQGQPRHDPPPKQEDKPMFQAPPSEWDATRHAPPAQSRPEAENFPSVQYTFENNQKSFKAPAAYPEPPKGMWYNVPESKPEPPKAIFPWEQRTQRNAPTRIFADDHPPTPDQTPSSPAGTTWQENSGGIEGYIKRAIKQAHHHAKTQASTVTQDEKITSPTRRRESSLVFTGLPALEDRPSLPVTPAPMVHNPFFLDAADAPKDAQGNVAEQAEWVCPSCGFASDDSAAFDALRCKKGSTANIDPGLADIPPMELPSPVTTPTPPARVEEGDDYVGSQKRPTFHSRVSSDNTSAFSNASTAVHIPTTSTTASAAKGLSKKALADPPPEPVLTPSSEIPESVPDVISHTRKHSPKPKPELGPPAWLTGTIATNPRPERSGSNTPR